MALIRESLRHFLVGGSHNLVSGTVNAEAKVPLINFLLSNMMQAS
jgi:hypothetical protein